MCSLIHRRIKAQLFFRLAADVVEIRLGAGELYGEIAAVRRMASLVEESVLWNESQWHHVAGVQRAVLRRMLTSCCGGSEVLQNRRRPHVQVSFLNDFSRI